MTRRDQNTCPGHQSQPSIHLTNARLACITTVNHLLGREGRQETVPAFYNPYSFSRGTTTAVSLHPAPFGSSNRTLYHRLHHFRDAKLTSVGIDPNILLERAGGTISQAMRPALKHRALPQ